MDLRPLFLACALASASLLAQTADPAPAAAPVAAPVTTPPAAPPPSVRVRAVISHPKANGKTDTLSTPVVTAVSGTEARVIVSGKPGADGKPVENALEMSASPTVQPDGTISLALRIVLNNKVEADPESEKKQKRSRKNEGAAVAHEGLPIFHSALPADGLFSLEDSRGTRRWVALGRSMDGWKLESYDKTKEILILTQGSARQELPLHKSVVTASATDINTVVTLRPGESTKIGGMGGVEVTVTADLAR